MVSDSILTQIQETGVAALSGRMPLKTSDLVEICTSLGIDGDKLVINGLPCGGAQIQVIED